MDLDRLIENLATKLKLDAVPQKNKKGHYPLQIGASPEVTVHPLDTGLFMTAKILPIPKEGNKEALFIYLMKANLLRQGTGGGAIGIDKEEQFFTLSYTLPFEVNDQVFYESLEDFLNYVDYWKEEIVKYNVSLL